MLGIYLEGGNLTFTNMTKAQKQDTITHVSQQVSGEDAVACDQALKQVAALEE